MSKVGAPYWKTASTARVRSMDTIILGLVEAQKLRLDLMAERTTMTEAVQHDFETYNLCEH